MTRYGLDMAEGTVTVISEGRNLRTLPFRPTEDQLSTGKLWEDWLESIEREFRFFRVANPLDRKDALIIYRGSEIARLEKTLPDPEDHRKELDEYQKLRIKLNEYFLPKKNKHYARFIFLKTRPEAGEATVAYATRLREKAHECEFGDTNDERILEHLIQTIENEQLIQKCISKSWTLQQFLREAGQIEDISIQVHDMKADTAELGIAKVMSHRRNQKPRQPEYHERVESVEYCTYCGLTRAHPRGKHCPAYGTQCNICKKFNHFSSVCRENVTQEAIMGQRSPMRYSQRKKPSIKRAEKVDQSSDTSSDEDFIEKSLMHMRIKTVSESTAEKKDNISSRDIQLLQGKVSGLENELWLAKNLIQDLLTRQQNKEHNDQKTFEQTRIISEKSEKNDGFSYSMQSHDQRESREHQMGFTMNSRTLDPEDYDEKKEQLHHVKLQSSQRKKQRKKKVLKTF